MGHHINKEGQFQSDLHPELPPNKITLSFKDPVARKALHVYAEYTKDKELADDIKTVLSTFNPLL